MQTPAIFPQKSDAIGWACVLAAAVLAWSLAISPANASNSDGKNAQTEQKDKRSEKAASNDKPENQSPSDLETCRRDADGKKGPERSRFMTACIKERKSSERPL